MQTVWDFWFKSIDARQYAVLRIAFGGLSAIYFIQLLPYTKVQFSGSGWLGNIHQIAEQNGGSWSLLFISVGEHATTLAYTVIIGGILSAFLLMVGWQSRIVAGITWLVWVSLWNRNPLLLDGDDAVLKIMCFYLMLSPCGNAWSVDAYLHNKPQQVIVWPLRLVQFQIALIYFVSGWVKFHSPEWQDGTVMQYVLMHPHYSRWDAWTVIDQPVVKELLPWLAWLIRGWELLFPLLLLNAHTRRVSLAIGVMFHLGLLLVMNLRWFAIIMLSLYPALISNHCFLIHAERVLNRKRKAA
ncbi:vitamin K-dependent gamma-carboxylase [Methyloglobulus morosus KoM1]|uniref:Vitamin K-dependent gamma-carboxylase n=1 Tax=Methyloglobulus morosus KoM1 TaxID=1116472 RepID=V5BEM0_9GAMM|nr:HTTM domain-containing protein [Methyloglobulus morosus]ESS71720.1 vitamin K-dependent gamma-carboxylase [Methyloglobulus morosus KoM1]